MPQQIPSPYHIHILYIHTIYYLYDCLTDHQTVRKAMNIELEALQIAFVTFSKLNETACAHKRHNFLYYYYFFLAGRQSQNVRICTCVCRVCLLVSRCLRCNTAMQQIISSARAAATARPEQLHTGISTRMRIDGVVCHLRLQQSMLKFS